MNETSLGKALAELGDEDEDTARTALENCDAVESDQYGYTIDGVLVSDFVFPSWFEAFRTTTSTQFDFQGLVKKPFDLLPGGYIGVFDVTTGTGWQQVTAQNAPLSYAARAHVGSRRERRRTPRNHWLHSAVRPQAVTPRFNRKVVNDFAPPPQVMDLGLSVLLTINAVTDAAGTDGLNPQTSLMVRSFRRNPGNPDIVAALAGAQLLQFIPDDTPDPFVKDLIANILESLKHGVQQEGFDPDKLTEDGSSWTVQTFIGDIANVLQETYAV